MINLKKLTILLDRTILFLTTASFLLFPLVMSPFTANVYDLPKRLFITAMALVLLIIWSLRNVISKSFRLTITPYTLPFTILIVAFLFSSLVATPSTTSKILDGSFIPPAVNNLINSSITYIALWIIFIIATTSKIVTRRSAWLLNAIIAGSVILGLFSILETIGFGPSKLLNIFFKLPVTENSFITPAGSVVSLVAYLIPTIVISLILAITGKQIAAKSLYLIASAALTAALVVAIFNILPGKSSAPVFLPFSTSWQIAAENIKRPKPFLIGVGPDNYISAFSASHDLAYNTKPYWNLRFSDARDLPLHLFTTIGLIGFLIWGWLLVRLAKSLKFFSTVDIIGRICLICLIIITIILFIIPPGLPTEALFFFLLTVLAIQLKALPKTSSELVLKLFAAKLIPTDAYKPEAAAAKKKAQLLPAIFALPITLISLVTLFFLGKVYAADISYRQAVTAIGNNDGSGTYNKLNQALLYNPYNALYRRAYATTNLGLADAISKKTNLTDQDKNNVGILVQQAIREGRNAVSINPDDPTNWEVLGTIYRNILSLSTDAKDWTVASYTEAIKRDPNNPKLRLDLGGVFYQLKDYNSANRLFEQAVTLKPDWANAHYNLANSYKNLGDLAKASEQYDAVISLIDPSTADYSKVIEEQNEIKSKLGQKGTTANPQTNLTTPSPLPSPKSNLNIGPEEINPPQPKEGDSQKSTFSDLTASPTPAATPVSTPITTPKPATSSATPQ